MFKIVSGGNYARGTTSKKVLANFVENRSTISPVVRNFHNEFLAAVWGAYVILQTSSYPYITFGYYCHRSSSYNTQQEWKYNVCKGHCVLILTMLPLSKVAYLDIPSLMTHPV
ncbi:hypothetical protein TNIN_43231 [Trichonephila inaurata madagascariensis]|uniref:Uncharacterized protein n=1 Tax=Trichonephila inaurata madagascariensis TaxID=2747483 RepID=A0A8X6Y545_9ARAC|nr:hypothetical protein TNIN_43231 [Trichonephila inaurata madagascariensis]